MVEMVDREKVRDAIEAHGLAASQNPRLSYLERALVVDALERLDGAIAALPLPYQGEAERVLVGPGDPWPDAVSDGLTLGCGVCGIVPSVDYGLSDVAWENAVPEEYRLGVVCLECLLQICPDAVSSIERVQVCAEGRTIELKPTAIYDYRALATKEE